jgi:UbiD family decarboxylase
MGYFKDLREHITALDQAGLLVKIDEQINKDTELMPLVRWQFRGLSEEERRAFMLAGAPIDVVKCITNDVLVPANAEIVIEGEISTEFLEPEAPFGESTGYIAERLLNPYFEVKCITHRKNPILATIISQMPPSESSVMRQVAAEGNYLRFLRDQCNIPGIIEVAFHSIAVRQICVIKMKKINQAHVWQALHSMVGYNPATGKMVIAVDEDIDPRNLDSLFWAMAFRHATVSRRADHPQPHAANGPFSFSTGPRSGAFPRRNCRKLRDADGRDA